MLAHKRRIVQKKYIHYQCSNCGGEVSYADVRCPGTGCGVLFLKGDIRDEDQAQTKTPPEA